MPELFGLFSAAFLSASFFPFQSELIFIAMLVSNHFDDWVLLLVASAGNILGAALNWWLGKYITRFENERWFPVKKAVLTKAERWFTRYGKWSLLLSWVPIIGDPLTMIAGVLRMHFLPFILIVALAKTGRYFLIMLAL